MNKNEYKWYSELIYGGAFEDRTWAEGTTVWKQKLPSLINDPELMFGGILWKRCNKK